MSIKEASEWYDSLDKDVGYKVEKNKNDFAVLLNTLMMKQGISKADLARLTQKSAPYVTKVLRGDTNLTISSMTKLLDSIDCELHISGCHKEQEMKWFSVLATDQEVVDLNQEQEESSIIWAKQARHQHEAA